ncbi:MAG: TetR family transcriptional regulator, partial [Solirubrobacteraceae bacterium]
MVATDDTRRRPRRRLSGPARRSRILEAALTTFAATGYGATGMGDVASASGVTRAVL